MTQHLAITEDGARLDVAMYCFWGEKAYVDVRVFNLSAQSNFQGSLSAIYRKHGQEKQRHYDQRVKDIEHASFTPLYYQQQVEWGMLLLHSIEDLPKCWQKK